jgi:hypothetical protein
LLIPVDSFELLAERHVGAVLVFSLFRQELNRLVIALAAHAATVAQNTVPDMGSATVGAAAGIARGAVAGKS